MNRTTSVRLTHADFFTSETEHTFHYFVEPGNGAAFPLLVHVANVEGMDALIRRGHENLITILQEAIGLVEKMKEMNPVGLNAGGDRVRQVE
jgi:hypothetical protein